MDPRDAEKTAFFTPDGHWAYCCMPFGLECAPAIFQRMMDSALSDVKESIEDDVFEENQPGLSSAFQAPADPELEIEPEPEIEPEETDEEEEEAVRLMDDEYLLNELEKSSSDRGDENSPEAINRQQMRKDLRKSFIRFNKALEKRAINVSDEEADRTVCPDDYYNPLPVGYLSEEHNESEDSDESEEIEEEDEEFLCQNEDIERDENSSKASCSEPEFQVEILPATRQTPRADEIREKYLTAGRSPSTPMWNNTVLKAVQANCKELDYDDHKKSFYWKDAENSDDNTSTVIARPSTCQTNVEDVFAASSSMAHAETPKRKVTTTSKNLGHEKILLNENQQPMIQVEVRGEQDDGDAQVNESDLLYTTQPEAVDKQLGNELEMIVDLPP
ncbi:uncharacterized protein LOC128668470 [Microplitis demolitor]|uniref:uncharacterized protein LOC128668470 n=1 Tax=Microplitis demolitor TaxID=69319 RepID=UPI00235B6520|nr:uncharacterized protein LOC128668470 [Microplitis demolitor]